MRTMAGRAAARTDLVLRQETDHLFGTHASVPWVGQRSWYDGCTPLVLVQSPQSAPGATVTIPSPTAPVRFPLVLAFGVVVIERHHTPPLLGVLHGTAGFPPLPTIPDCRTYRRLRMDLPQQPRLLPARFRPERNACPPSRPWS